MSNIRFVNLSSYTTPEVKEYKNVEWVSYGDKNDYFQYLIDRYNGSASNSAIINGISELIYGKGLDATDSARRPLQYAQMKSLFSKDCMRKVSADLKMMGQCAFQIIYSKDHSKVTEVHHMPIESLRAERCNDEGDVEAYYYAKDWDAVGNKKETPLRIPSFGQSNEGIEILYVRPYRPSFYYYSPVDYQGGLPYAELEEEVSNYHLNNIKNGMSPSMLINFNNGVPTEEERYTIENRIAEKYSGTSNSGKFILSFNDNKEMAADITPVQLSDASDQYQFLADESMRKLMVSHRVTSPMLLGIKDQSGLGNNAEELKTASALFDNTVIRVFQELLLDAVDKILAYNDISLNVYFKTLQPLEFKDDIITDKETKEEETGVKLGSVDLKKPCQAGYEQYGMKTKNGKKVPNCIPIKNSEDVRLKEIDGQKVYNTIEEAEEAALAKGCKGHHEHEEDGVIWYMPCESHDEVINMSSDIDDEHLDEVFAELEDLGEVINEDEWELIEEAPVDYDAEAQMDKFFAFASTGVAKTNAKSSQDGVTPEGRPYKIRYGYAPKRNNPNSREFCKKMEKANKVYRKEDILAMGSRRVNAGFGPRGADTYDIWLYKGGARCHHFWMRKVFMAKEDARAVDAKNPRAEISVNKAKREGADVEVNDRKVATRPVDMPNQGFLNPR